MNQELTTPDPHADSKAIVARLLSTGQQMDIHLPATLAEQQQWALARYDQHINYGVQFGYALVVIKQQIEHGAFIAWLESSGINKRTAQDNMKAAKFLGAMGDDSKARRVALLDKPNPHLDPDLEAELEIDAVLAQIIKLPLRKQLVLAQETPERIREYLQTDLFAEIDKMSPSEIRAVIRQQKEIEKLRTDNGNVAHEVYLKDLALKELHKLPKQRLQMDVMRKQILEDCELVHGAMQRLRKIFESAKHFTQDMEEDGKNLVAHPAIHTLDAIAGHAYDISNYYRSRWGFIENLPMSSPLLERLTSDELFAITEAVKAQQAATKQYDELLKQRLAEEQRDIDEAKRKR